MLENINKSPEIYFQVLWDNLIIEILENSYTEISFINSYKVQNIFLQMNPTIIFQEDNEFLKNNIAQFLEFIIKKLNIQLPNFYHSNSNGSTKYATINFNYSYTTLVQGFNFILKVLENKPINQNLISLGFTDPQQDQLLEAIKNKSNILISGVTGSGKTTTMNKLFEIITLTYPQLKIANIEDNFSTNEHCLSQAKNIIRSNVDIVCFGEIRTQEHAQAFQLLCENNIQVIGTIHANSALGILDRLSQLDSHSLVQHINLLINQTLIKKNCVHCCVHFNDLEELRENSETPQQFNHYNSMVLSIKTLEQQYPHIDLSNVTFSDTKGCKECGHLGVSGMDCCAQIITIDPRMHELIEKDDDLIPYLQFLSDENPLSDNMVGKSVKDHAIYKMLTGSVDPIILKNKFNS